MIRTIELPQVGESVTEGVIGKWLVEPGQRVEKYDPLVEVVTDKVSMEAPSPYTGVFVRALAEEGETVPMGQPICEMDVDGEEPAVVPAEAERAEARPRHPDPVVPAQAGTQGARAAHEAGSGDESQAEDEPAEDAEDAPAEEDAGRVGGAWAMPAALGADAPESGQDEEAGEHAFEFMDSVRSVGPTGSGEGGEGRRDALQEQALAEHEHESASPSAGAPDRRHVVSPLVARLSAQYGIDLSTIRGTGTGGRITSKDLLDAVNRLSAPAQTDGEGPEAAVEVAPQEEEAASEEETAEQPLFEKEAASEEASDEQVVEEEAVEAVAEEAEEEQTEAMAEPVAEAIAEEEAAVVPEAEAEDESASPVIPAPAGIQGARAAHEEEAGPVGDLEASDEPVPEDEEVSPLLVGEGEGEDTPAEEAAPEAQADEEQAPAPAAEATSVMPLTPVRRIIAEHMARSSREIPAAWSMVETDVTRLVRAREALRAAFEERHGIPLTYLPFAAAAVAAALREHPRLNARWDDGHITLNNRVNLAVAVATEAGLMVPVVRDADTLSIAAIAAELRRLTDGARAGTLGIEDVQGGTFTLNNTGALGSVVSVPIINHPQAAILTTEAIVKRPVVVEGDAIAVRSMMNLCLTFDHRVCDGAEAGAFLSAVKARLEVIDETIGLG
ncbi:MAG: 2-oxo acid dehydrogenase subunit E2 [Chloroflexota bacterium]|nr:2-oxo acid dehydrogenase subunit E2 [Chloroflexota bacterium]MDE2883638.1 2-oxo acid dehydrogenase subunit E2 [Chloroflexota bacterium]